MNIKEIKKDFPIFERKVLGKDLVYLDNAATTQKPYQVTDSIVHFYQKHNSNVHRGIHTLSEEATQMYENSREIVADFIGARFPKEVIFTKGTTDSINFVAYSYGLNNLKEGDVILTTISEHHSNLIPWQFVSKKTGALIKSIDLTAEGLLDIDDLKKKMDSNVKIVAVNYASNVLGSIFPVKKISKIAHEINPECKVVVDAAQAVPHIAVNVQSLGCDFLAFSGHKMLGPMGIGVLYIKENILDSLEPYQFGGGMINNVDFSESNWAQSPEKFEAGTPNVAGAIGLATAVEYLQNIGMENVRDHEIELSKYVFEKLNEIKNIKILGPKNAADKTGLITFYFDDIHAHDVAAVLAGEGVAVRAGHHCTQPLHKCLKIAASIRASFYIYNSKEDIDKLFDGIKKAQKVLG